MLMFISDFSISRPIVTVVTMVALVIFGLFALFKLQTDEYPDVQQPVVAVSISYPGAAPEVVEREVTDPVEEAISGISGVDKIQSSSMDGFVQIIVFFVFEKDPQVATQEIRDKISAIRSDLPTEMKEPVLTRFDPDEFPIVTLALSSDRLTAAELTRIADPGLTSVLKSIQGVADVRVDGGVDREISVLLNPNALQAMGVSANQVVQSLETSNLAAPVGRIEGALTERAIRLRGRLDTPAQFGRLVVANRDGRVIRLQDVATVQDGNEEPRTAAVFNGKEAVGIEILKSKGYSTTAVADAVRAQVAKISTTLPAGTHMDIVQDAGIRVTHSVRNVQEALFEGAFLTVLVVFLFLNSWRSTVITGLALPISVLAAFVAVWALGFTLNTMSLLGLSLAIGLLIDDAIVVRENIVRHVQMGKDHLTAAREATSEIGLAVSATTFSIMAVFVPVAFMYGVAGQWFKPFALTIAAAVMVSLFVSFSLDPMLSAYWLDPQLEMGEEHRTFIGRLVGRFNGWFDRQADNYKRVIAWALDHRLATVLIASGSLIGALALQVTVGGFGFAPNTDRSELSIDVDTPPGSNVDYTKIKAEEAAKLLRTRPEVAYTFSTVGTATGAVDEGSIYVRMVPRSQRKMDEQQFAAEMRRELGHIGGATYSIYTDFMGGNRKPIQIALHGPDANTLAQLADRMAAQVRQVRGAVDVGLSTRGQKPELEVQLDRGLASDLGVSVADVGQTLRVAFAGVKAGDWVDPTGQTRDVNVRLLPAARENPSDLSNLPLVVPAQGSTPARIIPLGQIATIKQGLGPAQIDHLNRDRVIDIQANTSGRSLGVVMRDITARLNTINLPPGYSITMGGDVEEQMKVFNSIFAALAVAVLLMYLILVVQFGSFIDPIPIMMSLPLSLIGVVLALLVTGDTLNIMSLIGVILLMGLVAKNAILLIDFAKWGRERGLSRREALIQAGRIRLRPILMTTFALIAGMFPVALGLGEGADFRAPLGRAVIGGVITATLLTLLVIPTVYEILDEWKEALLARAARAFGRARHGGSVEPFPAEAKD
jgi:hydrophobic/amphiphilic exporter-1 (mainly G- bacteria), HAE1 family